LVAPGMEGDAKSWLYIAVFALFLTYMLGKLKLSLASASPEAREAKRQIEDAKRRARQAGRTAKERADAWREAAMIALEQLERPNLAASYARRAERADPDDAAAVRVLSLTMREAGRLRALERLLWRRLAQVPQGAAFTRTFEELIALYAGPMKRPDRAVVLRRLRSGSIPPSTSEG
jgi:hypothetical protein